MAYLYKFSFPAGKKMLDVPRVKFHTSFFTILIFLDTLTKWIDMHVKRGIGGFKDVATIVVETYRTPEKSAIRPNKFRKFFYNILHFDVLLHYNSMIFHVHPIIAVLIYF